jgi:hypothetical protein
MMDTREKVFKMVVTLQPFFDAFVDLSQICLLFYRKLSPFSHFLVYAVSSIVAIIGALQIYFKMTTGEGDVTKSIMMLIGACLFIIGASIVFPAFYGYQI